MDQVIVDWRKVNFTLKTFDFSWPRHKARPVSRALNGFRDHIMKWRGKQINFDISRQWKTFTYQEFKAVSWKANSKFSCKPVSATAGLGTELKPDLSPRKLWKWSKLIYFAFSCCPFIHALYMQRWCWLVSINKNLLKLVYSFLLSESDFSWYASGLRGSIFQASARKRDMKWQITVKLKMAFRFFM